MRHYGFAIDNNVGNAAVGQNLARFVAAQREIEATFCPIELVADDLWQRLPGIRGNKALTASARAAAALHRLERSSRLDAAFIHSQSIALFSLALMRRVPTLISSDATPANLDQLAQGYDHRVYNRYVEAAKHLWTRSAIRSGRVLVGFSRWVTDSYVRDYGVSRESTHVIPPGVDLRLWRPDRTRRPGDGVVRVLFTGGDFRRKGGDILLRWLARRRDASVELHLVTREPLPATERVHVYAGLGVNAPELVALAQRCDVFALPTRADCYSIACLEANAAGLPAVISDVGGISEIVRDGESGYLVPPGDETSFCARLDALVADRALRARMGKSARQIAETQFDGERNARAVLQLMASL